jgi:hypothetical protein
MVFVIEKVPGNFTLKTGTQYVAHLNFDLDGCKQLAPGSLKNSLNDYSICNTQCASESLTQLGTCIDSNLGSANEYQHDMVATLRQLYSGKCLCQDGYTGQNSFNWDYDGNSYTLADICDSKFDGEYPKCGQSSNARIATVPIVMLLIVMLLNMI